MNSQHAFSVLLKCTLVIMVVFAGLLPVSENVAAQSGGTTYPLREEFDDPSAFQYTAPDRVYISGGQVIWNVSRAAPYPQYVYRSIPEFSGDVRLTVRGQVNWYNNNCGVWAGIGDGFGGQHRGEATAVNFGFLGGGCGPVQPTTLPGTIVGGAGTYAWDYGESTTCNFWGNWLRINPGVPYEATLIVSGGTATLRVPGALGATQANGIPPFYSGPYNTLFVGITGGGDWPSCSGTIDYIEVEPLSTLVSLDIKPGSQPNAINCQNRNALVPVAVLTTENFNAVTIDHTTVRFEGAAEFHTNQRTGESQRHEEDVDGDGDIDLVFHFRFADTNLGCSSTEGTLTGYTYSGRVIRGTDSIWVNPAN